MARQTITTTGAQTPINFDWFLNPFCASWAVEIPSGSTATYSVQFTLDNLNDATVATPTWFTDSNAQVGSATSLTGGYLIPIKFIRVNVAAISGSIFFQTVQANPVS